MLVYVSMRSSNSTSYVEPRDAISHDWARWFDDHKITPVLIPNALNDVSKMLDQVDAKAVILTGGDNLGTAPRDRTEQSLLTYAIKHHLPVLGTCRGLQMINTFFGGTLTRQSIGGHVATFHDIKIIDRLDNMLPEDNFTVNSYHNDCVLSEDLAKDLKPFTTTNDHVVEGLYHPDLPITAIQWHLERDNPRAITLDEILVTRWQNQCI